MPTHLGRRRPLALLALALVLLGLLLGDRLTHGRWLILLAVAWLLGLAAAWPELPPETPRVDRAVVQIAFVLVSCFVLVAVQLLRTQVVLGPEIAARSGVDPETGAVVANPRLVGSALAGGRGRILDRNGVVLAQTVDDGSGPRRVVPDLAFAPVVGYDSPRLYGLTGLEAAYDAELSGRGGGNALRRELDRLLGRPAQGLDLRLTLDQPLQDLAEAQLAGRRGAAVLLDARTGAVLALASSPHIDPNQIAATADADLPAAEASWATVSADPAAPLLPRATQGLLTPGSTFKVVTAAAAIDTGVATPDRVYADPGYLDVAGRRIDDPNRPDPGRDQWTLTEALGWSLNAVFGQVGLQLGGPTLTSVAERFGFGAPVPFDLPTAASRVATTPGFLDNPGAVADTAFGQGELLATPLQMALVAAAVANDGRAMRPYLVDAMTGPDGGLVWRAEPSVWRRPVSEETARQVAQMMVWGVEEGGYRAAAIPGATVGAKTGTAETGQPGVTHAWHIGFAEEGDRAYAVAVVLEDGGSGGAVALPVATTLLAAALGR